MFSERKRGRYPLGLNRYEVIKGGSCHTGRSSNLKGLSEPLWSLLRMEGSVSLLLTRNRTLPMLGLAVGLGLRGGGIEACSGRSGDVGVDGGRGKEGGTAL